MQTTAEPSPTLCGQVPPLPSSRGTGLACSRGGSSEGLSRARGHHGLHASKGTESGLQKDAPHHSHRGKGTRCALWAIHCDPVSIRMARLRRAEVSDSLWNGIQLRFAVGVQEIHLLVPLQHAGAGIDINVDEVRFDQAYSCGKEVWRWHADRRMR
jgi:hypothetical protein